ncbi:MAG: F0F1 ATP synthase subunit B [Parcubacteria group bacterium]|nr:F0F1 ATP synthase subunit B [Parcubacteria group bacterium]
MELLNAFGIDIRIFLAQLINFAVFLWLLHRFAYQPVLKLLEERTKKIEKGLEDAKRAASELTEASAKREEILAQTKQESKAILDSALASAGKIKDAIQKEAEEKAKTIVAQAIAQSEEEKKKMMADVKDEVLALAVEITEKILGEQVTELRDKKYIERISTKTS